MTKILTTLLFCLLVVNCSSRNKKLDLSETVEKKSFVLNTDSKDITILYNEDYGSWQISDILDLPFTGEINNVGFATLNDTIRFDLSPGESIPVEFILNEKDTINTIVVGASKPVSYDAKYIEENNGTYKVFLPEVHELVNIAVALTKKGRKDSNMVDMTSDYYKNVISHFEKFQNHPLLDSLNQNLTEDNNSSYNYYFNIKMNACMYSFDKKNIINSSPYDRLGFDNSDYLKELLPLLIDFSEKSDFKKFYSENKKYYESLISSYYELVPLNKMWKWLEEKFPNKYESYKVYFSPLVQGAHSTNKFSDRGFNEAFMFVNDPILDGDYSIKDKEAFFSRIVFTEIDHNYVNPMSDEFPEIDSILNPIKCWNNDESQWYANAYMTFNEYMTWSIFTLYMYDNFDTETFENANKGNTSVMVNGRGFPKFKEFNDFVLEWYKNNPEGPMEKLYSEVFEWIKKEDCEK